MSAPRLINTTVLKNIAGKWRNGYLAVTTNAAPYFETLPPMKGCGNGLFKTSVTATANGCAYATNGGPFGTKTGLCSGVLINNGTELLNQYNHTSTDLFGLTSDGHWVMGQLLDSDEAKSLNVTQAMSGFSWLVYNGSSVVSQAGGEAAPRTAIGVDAQGRLLMLEVDGCEKCKHGKGPTMQEMALLLASPQVGAVHAINLDGGGSSTTVVNGKVINYPTCVDIGIECQRSVATIACIH